MRNSTLVLLAALLCACGSLTGPAAGPSSVQLVVNTDSLSRDLSGNVLVRDAGQGQTVVQDFSFKAKGGLQDRTIYSGALGTTVDVCVADAGTNARLAGLRFKLVKASHLVLLQEDAGGAVSLKADTASEASPRTSCSSLQ